MWFLSLCVDCGGVLWKIILSFICSSSLFLSQNRLHRAGSIIKAYVMLCCAVLLIEPSKRIPSLTMTQSTLYPTPQKRTLGLPQLKLHPTPQMT